MQGTTGSTFSPDRASNRGHDRRHPLPTGGQTQGGDASLHRCGGGQLLRRCGGLGGTAGIVRGFDGTFRPEGRITRQQLAAILFRYTEYRGADTAGRTDLSRFSDSAAVADYAREALAWAVSAGLLQGRSDGTLDPSGSATRAQTAVILQRLETLLEKN